MQAGPRPRLGEPWPRAKAAGRSPLRAGRRHRSALHPLHLRHDRASPRAWCATMAAIWSRCMVDAEHLRRAAAARSSGRPPTSAGSWATPTSSTGRCCMGCTTIAVRGQAGRHAGCRRVLARDRRAQGPQRCSRRRRPSARSRRRTPAGRAPEALRPRRASARCSWPANGPIRTRCNGRRTSSACRSSIIGGRPRPAGPSSATRSGSARCRSSMARRRCRCPAMTCRSWTKAASPSARTRWAPSSIKLPLPPGCLPTLWQADDRFRESYLTAFPGYYNTLGCGLHR